MSYQEQYATVRTPFGEPGPYYDALGHRGTDYPCGAGEPVYAYSNFVVEYVGSSGGLGGVMGLRIPNGYAGWAHIVPALSEGASGGPGTIIGYAAGSGDDHGTAWTGPHIHTTFSPVSAQNAALGVRPLQDPAPIIAEYIGMTGTAASGVTGANDASLRSVQGDGITYWEPTGDLAKRIGSALIAVGALPSDYANYNDGDPGKVWREGVQTALVQFGYWNGTPDGLLGLHGLASVQTFARDHGGYTFDIDSDPQINSWTCFAAGVESLVAPQSVAEPVPAPVVEAAPSPAIEPVSEPANTEPSYSEPADIPDVQAPTESATPPADVAPVETVTAPSEPVSEPQTYRPINQGDIMALDSIPNVTVADGALGEIIDDPKARRRVYSVWVIIGLTLQALTGGVIAGAAAAVAAVSAGWTVWLVVGAAVFAGIAGAYVALTPQVATLARANVKK